MAFGLGAGKDTVEIIINAIDRSAVAFKTAQANVSKTTAFIKTHEATIRKAGLALTALGAIGVAAFGLMTKTSADFEQKLANVGSVIGKSVDQMGELEEVARKAGATTIFSASQAAEGMYYLASAGYDATQITSSLVDILDLAAATNTDLGFATETVVATLNAFNLEASEAGRVSNVFAAAIAGSQLTLERIGNSMPYVASLAKQLGYSVEEVTATLGVLVSNGIKAEAAGRLLGSGLARLLKPTGEAKAALEKYGLTTEDLNPSIHSLAEITDVLGKKNLSTADMIAVFGVESARLFMTLQSVGAPAIEQLTQDITGTTKATEMAEIQMQTLEGQVKLLKSAFEETSIAVGKVFLPTLTKITKGIKKVFDIFNKLPAPIKTFTVVLGFAAAATSLLTGISLLLLTKYPALIGMVQIAAGMLSKEAAAKVASAGASMGLFASMGLLTSALWAKITALVRATGAWVKNHIALTAATIAATASAIAHGGLGVVLTAVKLKLIALWVAMGPVGWAILGMIAVVTALIYVFNRQKKAEEDAIAAHEKLTETANKLSTAQQKVESTTKDLVKIKGEIKKAEKDHTEAVDEYGATSLKALDAEERRIEATERLMEVENEHNDALREHSETLVEYMEQIDKTAEADMRAAAERYKNAGTVQEAEKAAIDMIQIARQAEEDKIDTYLKAKGTIADYDKQIADLGVREAENKKIIEDSNTTVAEKTKLETENMNVGFGRAQLQLDLNNATIDATNINGMLSESEKVLANAKWERIEAENEYKEVLKEYNDLQFEYASKADERARKEKELADIITDSAKDVENAERNLLDIKRDLENIDKDRTAALQGLIDKQRDLIAVTEEYDDLTRSMAGSVLSVREAELSLEEAQIAYNKALKEGDELTIEKASIRLERAKLRLADANDRVSDTQERLNALEGAKQIEEIIAAYKGLSAEAFKTEFYVEGQLDLTKLRESLSEADITALSERIRTGIPDEEIGEGIEAIIDAIGGYEDKLDELAGKEEDLKTKQIEAIERHNEAEKEHKELVEKYGAEIAKVQDDRLKKARDIKNEIERLEKDLASIRSKIVDDYKGEIDGESTKVKNAYATMETAQTNYANTVKTNTDDMTTHIMDKWDFLGRYVEEGISATVRFDTEGFQDVYDKMHWIKKLLPKWKIFGYQKGGYVPEDMFAFLHKGEFVLPSSAIASPTASLISQPKTVNLTFYQDIANRSDAEFVVKTIEKVMRKEGAI